MRLPIQQKISLSFLLVLLLGGGLAIGLTWKAVEQLYLNTQKDNLLAQANLTAAAFEDSELPTGSSQPYMQTSNVIPGIHTRLVNESGAVVLGLPDLYQNQSQAVPVAENTGFVSPAKLLQRPEIQGALNGKAVTAVRKVDSAGGARVLYAAAPIRDGNQHITGIVYLATPLPKAGLPSDLLLKMIGIVLLATVLTGLAGNFLAKTIAQPIKALDQAALAVSKGDPNPFVVTKTKTSELRRLNESFNHMVRSLHQSVEVKNAFIADVTHELRTPLTVIKGTVETLEDGALDDLEGRTPLLTTMSKETDRLIRLVNDLLVLTRADARALQLKIQPVDLVVLSKYRCQHFLPSAERRNVELCVIAEKSVEGMRVNGDKDRLAQILDNLLDNAIRYAPYGSTVNIHIKKDAREILCEVVDQGLGIPAQHLPHIFERFYRVEPSRDRKTGGTGLGLAIVKALVKAQKGRIDVESHEGEGCKIRFWLPAAELPSN